MNQLCWYPGMTLAEMEKLIIEKAMRYCHGNKTQTAKMLGITAKTVDNKLHSYEKDREAQPRVENQSAK